MVIDDPKNMNKAEIPMEANREKFANQEIGESDWRTRLASPNGGPGGRPTRVWHREYWDRFIRDERRLQQAIEYIHQNPVKAGLVDTAEAWPWSSVRYANQGKIANQEKDADQEIGGPGEG
jgi:hypothetical protein